MKALVYIFSMLQGVVAYAQLTVGADATFFVDKSAVVQINGDAMNQGTFSGSGRINLTGNWENTKKFEHLGEFALIGTNQEISQNDGVFAQLLVEGGGVKSFPTNAGIGKRLELTKGLITPAASAQIWLKDTAETSLGSSTSYVNGTLYREGVKSKYFPVGAGGLFAPVELQDIDASAPRLGVTLVNPNKSPMTYGKLVNKIMEERYWYLTIKSGTYKSCLVSLPVFSEDASFYENRDLSVLQADAAGGSYLSLSGDATASTRISDLHYGHITSRKRLTSQYFTLGLAIEFDSTLLYIPNALSKNAPSPEDQTVKVYGGVLKEESFHFMVFNQWGNMVFETSSLGEMEKKGWNGENTNTGHHETTGKYNFVIDALYLNGDIFHRAGTIFIID